MAYDQTPTNNRGIFVAGAVTIVLLIGVNLGMRSYYTAMSEAVIAEKIASPEALLASRAAEKEALAKGSMTLDQAMAQLGRQGRSGARGGADITPQASSDLGALTGWNRMPKAAEAFVVPKPVEPATEDAAADGAGEANAAPQPEQPAPSEPAPSQPAPQGEGSEQQPH